MAKNNITN